MRTVVLRPRASYDLESILAYYAFVVGATSRARSLYKRFNEVFSKLCALPTMGHPINDDMLDAAGYRWWLVERYRIIYTCTEDELIIWRVVHERQDFDDFAFVDY